MTTTINAKSTGIGGLDVTGDASGALGLQTGGVTAVTIDTSQNVGIGTASPAYKLDVSTDIRAGGSVIIGSSGTYTAGSLYSDANWGMIFRAKQASPVLADFLWTNSSDVERMRIDALGNFLFNSGYGSVARAFGCRAWVKFDLTGAISASGNVTSVTDTSASNKSINLTNAMPDANYSTCICQVQSTGAVYAATMTQLTSSTSSRIDIYNVNEATNVTGWLVSIIR